MTTRRQRQQLEKNIGKKVTKAFLGRFLNIFTAFIMVASFAFSLPLFETKHAVAFSDSCNSGASINMTWTEDKTRPDTAPKRVLENGDYTNSYAVTANWTAVNEAAYYKYFYWNSIPSSPYKKENPNITTVNGISYSGVFNQGMGDHFGKIQAFAGNGVILAESCEYGVTYGVEDSIAPEIKVLSPTEGQSLGGTNIELRGSIKDERAGVKKYTYQLFKADDTNTASELKEGDPMLMSGEDSLLGSIDIMTLLSGTYYVHVDAIDKAGNTSLLKRMITITHPAPNLTVNSYNPSIDTTPVITGTIDDVNAVITVLINEKSYTASQEAGKWRVVSGALQPDTYTAIITATNAYGSDNKSISVVVYAIALDSVDEGVIVPNAPVAETAIVVTPASTPLFGVNDNTSSVIVSDLDDNDTRPLPSSASETTSNNQSVLAATDTKAQGVLTVLGLAWYWWLVIVAALATLLGMFIKRKRDQQA